MAIHTTEPKAKVSGTVTAGNLAAFTGVPGELEDSGINAVTAGSGNVISTGALGSEPGSPASGDLYLPNNGFYLERYSGSAWTPWGPIFPLTAPDNTAFSWVNQGSATVTTTNGGIYLFGPKNLSNSWRLRVKTAPATPYTVTFGFLPNMIGLNQQYNAVGFRESSTGKLHVFTIGCTSAGTFSIISTKWTNETTFSADYQLRTNPRGFGMLFLRIADDGANRICSYSTDGVNFIQYHSIGRTDFLTGGADQVFFGVSDSTNTYDVGMTLLSYKEA